MYASSQCFLFFHEVEDKGFDIQFFENKNIFVDDDALLHLFSNIASAPWKAQNASFNN